MGRVFISYSHKDSLIVEQVNECLNKHHILTWFDINNIKASDHWDKHIKTAIYASDVFLMFYSHNYNQSEYCKKEFEMAKENNINIMVVGLDDSVNSFSIHEDISAIQRVKYDYNKNTVNELSNELLSHPLINRCKIVNNVKFDGTEDSFIHGISEIDNPKHQYFLKLFLSFLLDVKEKNNNGLYISNKANFSS